MMAVGGSPMDLINPAVDRHAVREALARDGVVEIANYLPPATATQLADSLEAGVRWDLAYSRAGRGELLRAAQLASLSSEDIRRTLEGALDFGRSPFQFVYDTFKVIDSFLAREYADHLLYRFANALHSAAYLGHVRELTGCARIARMDVFAARYRAGHFLTLHDDVVPGEGREIAYVLNLTREWRPEWGGLLQITDGARREVVRPSRRASTRWCCSARRCGTSCRRWRASPRCRATP